MKFINMGNTLLAKDPDWPEGVNRYKHNGWMLRLDTVISAVLVVTDQSPWNTWVEA